MKVISLIGLFVCLLCSNGLSNGKSLDMLQRVKRQTSTQISNFTNIVGPRNVVDLVLIIDRSKGIGKERFYFEEMPLIRAIVQQYATIHPDYVRIAAITFAKDSTLVFDHISSDPITKCEFFEGSNSPWEKVRYNDHPDISPGTNLKDSMEYASSAFIQGRANRPTATQVLLVITDGDYKREEDPITPLTKLKDSGVIIFSMGLGPWLEPGSVRILASDPQYFGYFEDWRDLTLSQHSALNYDTEYLFAPVDAVFCNNTCEVVSQCHCDVDRAVTSCQCDAGYALEGANCVACEINQYKSQVGNHVCTECPLSFTSHTDSKGSTSKSQCICDSSDCTDPCDYSPCNTRQYCSIDSTDKSAICRCKPGWEGLNCSQNRDQCPEGHLCQNGGKCYDGVNDYACVCPQGFKGQFCQINEDECRYELCMNQAICEDGINDVLCKCASGFGGLFCQDLVAPTTISPTTQAPPTIQSTFASSPTTRLLPTTPSTTSPATSSTPSQTTSASEVVPNTSRKRGPTTEKPDPGASSDDNIMIIIIGAAAGGGGLILIIIIIIVCCCCCRKKKEEPEKPPERVDSLSQKFDGLWRGKTVRAGKKSYIDTITPISGLPSVPKRRPDLLGHMADMEAENEVEEAYFNNTTVTLSRSMGGWRNYIKELEQSGILEQCLIAKLTAEEHAKSSQWMYDWEEIVRLFDQMERQECDIPAHVQGGEYQITSNDGKVLEGRSIGSLQKTRTLVVGLTKNYVIIGIADAYRDDGKMIREIQWITDHIQTEGY